MGSMVGYSKAAMERAMKVQEVILRAMAKRITWWQAASASQAAPAPAAAGDAVAHRWQPASLVPGRALVRPAGDSRRCHQRDLLRAAGGRRIHADGDGGAEGSDRAAGRVLRLV